MIVSAYYWNGRLLRREEARDVVAHVGIRVPAGDADGFVELSGYPAWHRIGNGDGTVTIDGVARLPKMHDILERVDMWWVSTDGTYSRGC